VANAGCQKYRFATVVTSGSSLRLQRKIASTRAKKGLHEAGLGDAGRRENQLPATIIFSINTEPVRMLLRISRSLPTATICLNMSFMLPAMVTS